MTSKNSQLPDPAIVAELTAFADTLADAAADITLRYFRAPVGVDYKIKGDDHFDPVTIADRGAEEAIRTLIETHYPDHAIHGEEFGRKDTDSPFEWVLDPIDGTRAFISGLPTWGTLIALLYNGEPIIGVLDQPYLAERYVGTPNGSTLNGEDINTRPCSDISTATLSTTDPALFEGENIAKFECLRDSTRLIRYGLDCYAYAILSSGFMDIVAETGLQPYDMMALIPIIRGAGGSATNWSGGTPGKDGTLLALGDPSLLPDALKITA